ncbi:MAG: hypothetical protein L0H75_10720 [Nitrosospira sp.]|nr:hypothetical protein [Nitrosospira sp.]
MNQPIQIPEWVLAEVGRLHLQTKLSEQRIADLSRQIQPSDEQDNNVE